MCIRDRVNASKYRLYFIANAADANTHAEDFLVDIYGTDPGREYSCGMQLFNEDGAKIFDSNEYYMDVSGIYGRAIGRNSGFVINTYGGSLADFSPTISIKSGLSATNNSIVMGSCARIFAFSLRSVMVMCQVNYGLCFETNGGINLKLRCARLYDGGWGNPCAFTDYYAGIILNLSLIHI